MLWGNLQPAAGVIENKLLQVLLFILPCRAVKLLHQQVIPHPAPDKGLFNVRQCTDLPVQRQQLPVRGVEIVTYGRPDA